MHLRSVRITPVPTLDERARALAEREAWPELAALLAEHREEALRQPSLATLRGEALLRCGRMHEAAAWLDEVVPVMVRRGDRAATRRAAHLLGAARLELGELEEAERDASWALELGQEDDDDLLVARATNNLGIIANIRGRRESALALYALAVPAYQRLGSSRGLAECYHNMAITYRDTDQLANADEYERRAEQYAREASDTRLAALARIGRAEVTLRRGDAALAAATARHAARAIEAAGDPIRAADALRVAGIASQRIGDLTEARSLFDRALDMLRRHGGAFNEAETLRARAELRVAMGEMDGAREDAAVALAIFTRLGAEEAREELLRWVSRLDR